MDEAISVITELSDAGMAIKIKGDTVYISPASRITPELAGMIKKHKADIISLGQTGFLPIEHWPQEGEAWLTRYIIDQYPKQTGKKSSRRKK